MFENLQKKLQAAQFTSKLQQAFLEDMANLIQDGVPINRTIETIAAISKGISKEVAEEMGEALARGQLLADGMQGWFPPSIVEIVRAGENSGSLGETLARAAESLAKQGGAVGAVIASLVYPLVVLCGALGMLVFIKDSVFENFKDIKPIAQWSGIGRDLYHFASFIQHWWWFIILALVGSVVLVSVVLRHVTGDVRRVIDKMPILSIYRELIGARFMETLGSLMQNGVAFNKSLSILQRNAPPYFAWHLSVMEMQLSGGRENIADVIDTGLVEYSDLARLRVVAQGRGFEQALLSLGAKATARASNRLERVGKIAGGVVLGLGGFMAALMILGIYTVGSSIAG